MVKSKNLNIRRFKGLDVCTSPPAQSDFYDLLMDRSSAIAYRFRSDNGGKTWIVDDLSPQFSKLLEHDPADYLQRPVSVLWNALRRETHEKKSVRQPCVLENPYRGDMGFEVWNALGEKRYFEEAFQFKRGAQGKPWIVTGLWFDLTEVVRDGHRYESKNTKNSPRLTSRTFFFDRVHQAMNLAHRQNENFAVICLDLDRLGRVNQSFGYDVGDLMIRETAQRLSKTLYETDSIFPLGGDSFMVLIPRIRGQKSVEAIANKILFAFKEPFSVGQNDILMTCSLGIAVYPFDGASATDLMQHAYQVMRTARQKGGGRYHFFSSQDGKDVLDNLILEAQLRNALERNQFDLHCQPQIDLKTGRIFGVEALIRWSHPELGMVSPMKFIPIAEETGLIHSIGEWVLRTACLQRRAWEKSGVKNLTMAVNLSAKQFHNANIVDLVRRVLSETNVNPSELDLEITESTLMQYTDENIQTLRSLKNMGVRFSIDDFGTGFSSLGALKQMPVNTLKIDRSFVRDLSTDTDDQAITQAIISMAHDLRLDVVAEGIETAEQMHFLKSRNCDKGQGYLFSKPIRNDLLLPMLVAGEAAA